MQAGQGNDGAAQAPVNAYREWQKREAIPVITGLYVDDLTRIDLKPWARTGGEGAYLNLDGSGGLNDLYLCRIPAGGSLLPQRHLYEELIYIVRGTGSASVWYQSGSKAGFEWGAGSLFAIPLNAHYQLHNASGTKDALFVASTTAPIMMNLVHNEEFIFANDFEFRDRFSGTEDYFTVAGSATGRRGWQTNLVPDIRRFERQVWPERGTGTNMNFDLADSTLCAHISQFPPFTYKKAHRHGPGAHVIILEGTGYSLLWPDGNEPQRVNWKPNSIIVPPQQWWHQHFNARDQAATYIALRWNGRLHEFDVSGFTKASTGSRADGLGQIEYEDEDRAIHAEFERELASVGSQCGMKGLVPHCTA